MECSDDCRERLSRCCSRMVSSEGRDERAGPDQGLGTSYDAKLPPLWYRLCSSRTLGPVRIAANPEPYPKIHSLCSSAYSTLVSTRMWVSTSLSSRRAAVSVAREPKRTWRHQRGQSVHTSTASHIHVFAHDTSTYIHTSTPTCRLSARSVSARPCLPTSHSAASCSASRTA